MLKNQKLLYILPEMSFTACVNETPKQDYFFVKSFHQINGEFMKDENFLFENLKKLFERVDEETYTLVLPDFLFTDTIVNVPEIDDLRIAEHLRDQLLPRIEVSTFSHETRTSVLLQRKKTAKVQLSAFEKELAATVRLAIGSRNIVIDEVVPLSWTLKAIVSLEPSITIAQLGERLYLAEHYIGINQTVNAPLTELEIMAETVKTLKGSNPNLQTAYLLTSVLVEEKLKKLLSKTLPVQQLTEPSDEEVKIPSYVKQIIEVSARTLSLSEFAVPHFSLTVDEKPARKNVVTLVGIKQEEEMIKEEIGDEEKVEDEESKETAVEEKVEDEESKEVMGEKVEDEESKEVMGEKNVEEEVATKEETDNDESNKAADKSTSAPAELPPAKVPTPLTPAAQVELPAKTVPASITAPLAAAVYLPKTKEEAAVKTPPLKPSGEDEIPEISFIKKAQTSKEEQREEKAQKLGAENERKDGKIDRTDTKLPVRRKGSMGSFIKKILFFISIFVGTIALGIGIGWGVLALTDNNLFGDDAPASAEPTPLPTATPEATPESVTVSSDSAEVEEDEGEEVDLTKVKILVVNATSVTGLAGTLKTTLEKEGFTGVTTGNAKGSYDTTGVFVLMKEKNTSLIKALEAGSGKTLTYDEDYKIEDSSGAYDAVIVINESP
jgi:hypothetical protein